MFDPWMNVWQLMQGWRSAEPALIPWTVDAATGLWHWLHSWLMFATFNSRGFCEPCGVWQPMQPSPFTAACSNTNGPRVSVWHLVQIAFWSAVDLILFAAEGPVHIVAVAALHQAFIHLVVERHVELRLDVVMALEAKLRLRRLQQRVFQFPACTLWQLVQPTPAFACGDRGKLGCAPEWQPRQVSLA